MSFVMFIMIFLVMMSMLFLLVNILLNGYLTSKNKKTPFESGFNSIGKSVVSYNLSFFFLILIFVFFELEFFLIFFLVFFSSVNFYLFVMVIFFVTLGFILEWFYSKLIFLVN